MFKKLINISCIQATLLTSKREAREISFVDNVKLVLHYSICTSCKRFALQSKFIGVNAQNAADFSEEKLSIQKKIIIKELMQ